MADAADWEGLLAVIRAMSLVEDLDGFGPAVLDALDPLVPSDIASWNEVDPLARRAVVVGRPQQPSAEDVERWQDLAHQNPCLMHMLRTGDGSARRTSDFLSLGELHELALYREVYAPRGLEYQLSVGLPAPAPLVLGIALNRRERDFTEEEAATLDALRPYLAQAYRHVQLLTQRALALESIAGELQDQARAFSVLGEPLSGPARELLSSHFGAFGGDLPEVVANWAEAERRCFHEGEPHRLRQPLVSVRDDRRLTARFVPGGPGPDLLWMDEREAHDDARPLQRLGLSAREAQVLWLLASGSATKEIAVKLGLSAGTVKKHLEHVYRKLGVSNATSAVAQAYNCLSSLREWP